MSAPSRRPEIRRRRTRKEKIKKLQKRLAAGSNLAWTAAGQSLTLGGPTRSFTAPSS